jgi:hypothetical protein
MSMKTSLGVMVALVGVMGVVGCSDDDPEGSGGAGGAGASGSSSSSATSSSSSSSSSASSSSSSSSGGGGEGGVPAGGAGGEGGVPAGGAGGEGGVPAGGAGGEGGVAVGGAGGQGGTPAGGAGGEGGSPVADGTCAAPFVVQSGDVINADTTSAPGMQEPDVCGDDGPLTNGHELVYAFTATQTGEVKAILTPTFDGVLYVRSTCGMQMPELACDDNFSDPETVTVDMTAGQTVYFIVDGYDDTELGTFELVVDPAETSCTDATDNNDDGLVDCEDPDCVADAACASIGLACTAPPALAATQMGNTTAGSNDFVGNLPSSLCELGGNGANELLYSYTSPGLGVLRLELSSATDQGVYVRSDCDTFGSLVACGERKSGGTNELLFAGVQPAQALTVFVDGDTNSAATSAGDYTLTSTFVAVTTTEVEPNNAFGQANALPVSNSAVGFITPGDSDWYSITLGAAADIDAEIVDPAGLAGMCASETADTFVTIYAADGTTVVDTDDDGALGWCSKAESTASPAGTYYVRVQGNATYASTYQMAYQVQVTLTP